MKKLLAFVVVLCTLSASAQVKRAWTPRNKVYIGDTLECVIMIKDTRTSNLLRSVDTTEKIVAGFEIIVANGGQVVYLDPQKKLYPRYIKIRKL